MNRVGFKGFRRPEPITADAFTKAVDRLEISNLFVYWTGSPYKSRAASLRSNALKTITEVKTPVPVSTLLDRAAHLDGEIGYKPEVVKSGLYLHRNSKPAVYFALERKEDGSFVAATDVPYADGFPGGLKKGATVIAAGTATKQIASPKKPAQIAAPATDQPKLVKGNRRKAQQPTA
jgi:hypothetical protein